MMRALVVAIALLTIAAAPVDARGRGSDGSGRHVVPRAHARVGVPGVRHFDGHRAPVVIAHPHPRHAPFHRFVPGFGYYVPGFVYAPSCWWQEEYWIDQPYVDRYGAITYAQRVPGQWVCQ